jgi:aryl-alcohol dehydrogenase-like predicted oxidoreductase
MDRRALGRTGVSISRLCLGSSMFGAWGNKDHADSIRIIHGALDAGINLVDTADGYSAGEAEEIVGKALAGGRRDEVVLATKVQMPMGEDRNHRGGSRRWIIRAVEDSLRRLDTDRIDLYQLHRPDPDTDVEETLSAMSDLVHAGKVLYIGHSNFPPSALVEAQWKARERGLERFVCEQPTYSILNRGIEAELLPACRRHRMGVITYSPLGGGWLSGRYREDTPRREPMSAVRRGLTQRFDVALPDNQRKLAATDALHELADEAGLTLIELALAFVLTHPVVTAAIIGPRTMEHLISQLGATDVRLADDVLDRIDEIVAPGTAVNAADHGWVSPDLDVSARRPGLRPS